MTQRLNPDWLATLPDAVTLPGYDRDQRRAGIVHLGVGAFHRAHQAWYTEQVLNSQSGDWMITGASLRSPRVRDQLAPQEGLYTLVQRDGDDRHYQVIGAIKDIVVGPEAPEKLIHRLADPHTRVVTLTITEKGYCYDGDRDGLQQDNADIDADVHNFPARPVTAIGYLVAALQLRRDTDAGGVTLLSCDNLSHNGRVLKTVVEDFARRVDPALLNWIADHVTFPSSMVDRIVPASTEADLAALEEDLGLADQGAVFTEPFSQWVIEKHFARGAPDWQGAGAIYTDDVGPFEAMKLRLLNGSHSLMAYLGYLAGFEFVHEVMEEGGFRALVEAFMSTQAEPTLAVPDAFDLDDYKRQLCQRFSNRALNHRLYQIAQDGSQKIPQRWVRGAETLIASNLDTELTALAVAGWIRYLQGCRDNGETYQVDDPALPTLQSALAADDPVAAVLGIRAVFGERLPADPDFCANVRRFHGQITEQGMAQTVRSAVNRG